ncbi:SAC domain-containing protein, partial [Meloidogyne graminicola]
FFRYQFPDKFVVEPIQGDGSLEIDRYSNNVNLKIANLQKIQSSQAVKVERINGLIGIIELVSGPYLIFIKSATSVGMFNDAEIFEVSEADLVPFKPSDLHLSERERRINQNFVEMLKHVLSTDSFYYSIGMDISHSLQWLSENASPELHLLPLLQRIDKRFVWNAKLSEKFNTFEFSKFIQPLIHGFVGIRQCRVNNCTFNLALISRRSVYRPGVRFHTRGADSEGNCANFVETEQLVEFDVGGGGRVGKSSPNNSATFRHISSFIQIRGSIPIYWSQKPNLKWQPTPTLKNSHAEQFNCFKQHLNNLLDCYGRDALSGNPRKILLLSLLNQYGREKNIGSQFRSIVEKIPSVKFIAFDFHRHCQSLNWKRLSYLKEEILPDIQQFGCLDRTNVVQALIGIESLRFQLQYFGIISESVYNFDAWPEFVHTFKNLWADNGDICSKQYAGTGALKGRSTSRGRPSKRSARSSSASRKVKPSKVSPVQKKQSPQALRRISKSPQKSTPKEKARKTRSSSRTRKVNTAPPAVSAKKKKEATGSRPSSPQSYTSIKTITLTTTRGPPRPATASPLLFTNTLRGSLSPPTLRSRTAASTTNNQRGLTHSPSLQPKKLLKGRNVYFEQFKNCAFSRQLGKVGNSIKKVFLIKFR